MTDTENDPELDHIGLSGTGLHKQMEEMVQAHTDDQFREAYSKRFHIHDPEQDGKGFDQISVDPVICKSMQWGRGCGHPVTDHLHAFTSDTVPTADCHCCDGKRWDPQHIMGCGDCQEHLIPKNQRTEVGELPNPRVEMREYEPPISTDKMAGVNQGQPKTPEEMAEQLGVPVEKLGEALQAQIDYYTRASQEMLNRFIPPKMNRAQRRAQVKARRRRGR